MKKRLLPFLLALCLALSVPASALGSEDFRQGQLSGLAAAGDGALLVTDVYNKVVWRIEGDKVTRYAGVIGAAALSGEPTGAYHDDTADRAYFLEPWDIAPFLDGFAVSDASANVVRYIANGRVYTLAGTGKAGRQDGSDKRASFDRPTGLAAGSDGSLYVADTNNGAIRCISKKGAVTTVVTGLTSPTGLCWHDGALYVAETGRSRICRVVNGRATPFAGVSAEAEEAGEYYGGYADAAALSAKFDHPQGLAAGADGTIYVADTGNSAVRAIRDGRVYTIARGAGTSLMPASPRGLLAQGDTLYAADVFAGSVLTRSVATRVFTDVAAGAWYESAVYAAVRQGIAGGTGAAEFEPDSAMDRAMFVTMLSNAHKLSDGTAIIDGEAAFSDVPENEWYAAPVRWAADGGVTTGENGLFAPKRSVSRQEMVTFLYRYAKAQGLNVAVSSDGLAAFSDASAVAPWAADAMRWAVARGIVSGMGDGRLQPGGAATRAQALTILLNFMKSCSL